MFKVVQLAGSVLLGVASKGWRLLKSPFGQGVAVGAASSSVVESVSGGVSSGIDKGKDFVSSLTVLGLVGLIVFLTVKKK